MPVSMPVTCFKELKSGDHIKWKRLLCYDHHGIVEYVDDDNRAVLVIEYRNNGKGKAEVKENWVTEIREMYKYIYDKCYDGQQVVKRAMSKLGERAYNLVTNNCEHFATWCKTGWKRCSQIEPLKSRVAISNVAAGNGCIASCAFFACKNAAKSVLKGVGNAIVNGGKKIGYSSLKSACSAAITGALTVVSEVALFGYNCYKAQRNYEAAIQHAENDEMKKLCKEQINWNIAEAGFEGVGGMGGAAVGAAIGSFIPFVGTAIGAMVGNVVGRVIEKTCGRLLRRFGTWQKGLFC